MRTVSTTAIAQSDNLEVQIEQDEDGEMYVVIQDEWCAKHDWRVDDEIEVEERDGAVFIANKSRKMRELREKVNAMMDPEGW